MRIAIAGILNKPILKSSFGGTESFTYQLTENLVRRFHDVTLFADAKSQTSARLESFFSFEDQDLMHGTRIEARFLYHLLQTREIAKRSLEFDLVHNNYYDSFFFTPFIDWFSCPTITTVHNDFWQYKDMKSFFMKTYRPGKDIYVFVSNNARKLAGDPEGSLTIYNGINVSDYAFEPFPNDSYLFWLSRVTPKKGAKEAVEAAIKTQKKLILSGMYPTEYKNYFQKYVGNLLSETINFIGPQAFKEKINYYKNARAFIFPIQWEEPFGLVMIEAMATGTPVVAFARGSVPEVIKDGETGFIVNPSDEDLRGEWIIKKTGIDGLCEAVEKIYSMPEDQYREMRRNCRAHVEKNFTVEQMVSNYEKVYQQILQTKK